PMLETLWEDKEYYVHKAMAWCLRELSKSNSDKVTSFLINRLSQKLTIEHVNKTFVKNCIKKLPSKEQSKILNLI
ncbi:MAG: DNA alkylation repair protein, partial [Candidatus Hodarchaeales archaeon]